MITGSDMSLKIIPEDEQWALPPPEWFKGQLVYELGNKKNTNGLYQTQYRKWGARYQCFDWNALDGAINLDFGERIPAEYEGVADIVTNFGFTEHVFTDQIQCWENVARMSSKVGCYLAIVLPTPGHWEHHGVYQPPLRWLQSWMFVNGYKTHTCTINDNRRRHVNVVGAQRVSPFDPEQYHTPDMKLMHITKPSSRVNIHEKNCGVTP